MTPLARRLASISVVAALVAHGAAAAAAPENPAPAAYTWEKEVFVPMRDGINLSTDVLLPKGAQGRLPTVLIRTPYDKDRVEFGQDSFIIEKFLSSGYAVVLQSERGHWFSEGVYENYLAGANKDGSDTLDWIVKQPWSDGKVGAFGCSSSGEQQWGMARSHNPALVAMLPLASGQAIGAIPGNDTQGINFRGGVPTSGLNYWWYHDMVPTERLVLPPNTTQAQRIRLRTGYNFQPAPAFYHLREDGSLDWLNPKGDYAKAVSGLPSKDVLRALGGPLTPADKYITWSPADTRWDEVETVKAADRPRTPAIHYSTWHDIGVGESARMFKHLQDLGTPDQYLILGAGPHCELADETKFGDFTFGDLPLGDIRYNRTDGGFQKLYLAWFDHWLKGAANGVLEMPKVQLYVMNRGWVSGPRYPLPQTKFTPLYLADAASPEDTVEAGDLTWSAPKAALSKSYVYDPLDPTPTHGGGCCDANNALDQRGVEARKDVLVFSTPRLAAPVSIAGPVAVTLYVSSSAKDTDFMVKLVDVLPDGRAINMNDDAFRMRYRDGYDKKVMMTKDGVYKITLVNMVTAVRFAKGHRIRLEVASSNFPLLERNLNTGGNNYDETQPVTARNTVHLGGGRASHVLLPVIPE